jgi:hypothetical protein
MIIYFVYSRDLFDYSYDGALEKVYINKEKAEKYAKRMNKKDNGYHYYVTSTKAIE